MAGGEVERFRRRLQLLSEGRLVEAQDLVVGTSAAAKKAGGCQPEKSRLPDNLRLPHLPATAAAVALAAAAC